MMEKYQASGHLNHLEQNLNQNMNQSQNLNQNQKMMEKYQASGHLNHLEQKEHDQNLDSFLIQSQNTNQSQSQNTNQSQSQNLNQSLKQSTCWFWKEWIVEQKILKRYKKLLVLSVTNWLPSWRI